MTEETKQQTEGAAKKKAAPKKESNETQSWSRLPDKVKETLEKRKDLKAVYIHRSGKRWFFNKKLAQRELKEFDEITNPYHEPATGHQAGRK